MAGIVISDLSRIVHDDTDDGETCSVDTNDAFLEMLGLPATQGPLQISLDAEETNYSVLALPPRCSRRLHPPSACAAFSLDKCLSRDECRSLVDTAASLRFRYVTQATHVAPDGTTHSVQIQNPNPHKLSVFEDSHTVEHMWRILQPELEQSPCFQKFQQRTGCGPPLGLNPRLRVLRYDYTDNDRFEPHFDATTKVGQLTSLLTVLLYLNDGGGVDFAGGETLYLNHHTDSRQITREGATMVIPKTGRMVIFEHDLFHSGALLDWGTKYVLRTDVLFAVAEASVRSDNEDTEPLTRSITVADLCLRLGLSPEDTKVLDDCDLLENTAESFLSAGITLLKNMLVDGGISTANVNRLVQEAVSTVNC